MKPTIEIAMAELKKMFFTPVAWLVLIVFAYHVYSVFAGGLSTVFIFSRWAPIPGLTNHFFASGFAGGQFFFKVAQYFHLYIPLLAMNVLSREFSSGSIKLLYSSPISNREIVFGKYLSLVFFGFLMILLVAIPSVYLGFYIDNVEWPFIFNGLTGLLLLFCSYAAIGLYMSSLTSYGIIAVISSLAVLTFLNAVGELGQNLPVIRDIFYWFSIDGRSSLYIHGLISTESILYFIAVIGFFLALTYMKLKASREKRPGLQVAGQYMFIVLVTALVGYISSLPAMKIYWDVTRSQLNTISKESQKIVKKLEGGLNITSYSNMLDMTTSSLALPKMYKNDIARYEAYVRFKPEIRLNYKYYYQDVQNDYYKSVFPGKSPEQLLDTLKEIGNWNFTIPPYHTLKKEVDLSKENFRFVSTIKRENGKNTFLRVFDDPEVYPNETQISAALKRLVEDLPKVGFVAGHGERSIAGANERGYQFFTQQKTFRYSLLNNGFDFENISLSGPVPEHIRMLVLADARYPFSDSEWTNFRNYVNKGGDLLIATEPGRDSSMGPVLKTFGINTIPGTLIQPKKGTIPEVLMCGTTPAADSFSYFLEGASALSWKRLIMNTATGLEYQKNNGFDVMELFTTDTTSAWNELETKNFAEDSATYNPEAGEVRKPYVTALALCRKVNDQQQKIVVTGDADWLNNGELHTERDGVEKLNYAFIYGMFNYLSDGELPVDTRRPPPIDNKIKMEHETWERKAPWWKWGVTCLLFGAAAWILIRRKGR